VLFVPARIAHVYALKQHQYIAAAAVITCIQYLLLLCTNF